MAQKVRLIHDASGITKTGFYGFSWTTLFFGFFPALFRSDWITFLGGLVIYIVIDIVTFGIGGIVASIAWAFMYNGYYTKKLIERGYRFADTDPVNAEAALRLGIAQYARVASPT